MLKRLEKNRLFTQWVQQLFFSVVISCLYVITEWIFLTTKPSFLDKVNLGERLLVLLKGGIFLGSIGLCVLILLGIFSLLFRRKFRTTVLNISSILPAAMLASMLLLLIDNFTYTVFKFGIVNSTGVIRAVYAVVFLGLVFLCFKLFATLLTLRVRQVPVKLGIVAIMLLAVIFVIPTGQKFETMAVQTNNQKLPNIILIGSDCVNADHMSVYGYKRETTPFLEQLAQESLVVENQFTNAGNTAGSVVSMLTGKYPSDTRVLYPPDMLTGGDAYEHLPGILKSLGYYNVQMSVPHYADAYTLGMLNGFDEVNGELAVKDTYLRLVNAGFLTDDAYFLSTIIDRIFDRLMHIFYLKQMDNPYNLVTDDNSGLPDEEKISSIFSLLDASPNQPVFVHAHLLGTHGPWYYPDVQVFSAGKEQKEKWMIDYYDDSILNFDRMMEELYNGLKKRGQLDNTIVVIYSDHGRGFLVKSKLPMIIRFPNSEYQDTTVKQAENLDIAPTLLDYLGVDQPSWMSGSSFIDPDYSPEPVISYGISHAVDSDGEGWVQDEKYLTPPFYQFDFVNLVDCQKWYKLDLTTYKLTSGQVEKYTHSCSANELLSIKDVYQAFRDRLTADGFTLPKKLDALLSQTS